MARKMSEYRRAYLRFQVSETRRKLKKKAIEYKGGKCEICGYDKCVNSMAFHHVDPSQKDFAISGDYKSFDRIKSELDKTRLLCHNCHGELHDSENQKKLEVDRAAFEKMVTDHKINKHISS